MSVRRTATKDRGRPAVELARLIEEGVGLRHEDMAKREGRVAHLSDPAVEGETSDQRRHVKETDSLVEGSNVGRAGGGRQAEDKRVFEEAAVANGRSRRGGSRGLGRDRV